MPTETYESWGPHFSKPQEPLLSFAKGPVQNEMECNKARWRGEAPGPSGLGMFHVDRCMN